MAKKSSPVQTWQQQKAIGKRVANYFNRPDVAAHIKASEPARRFEDGQHVGKHRAAIRHTAALAQEQAAAETRRLADARENDRHIAQARADAEAIGRADREREARVELRSRGDHGRAAQQALNDQWLRTTVDPRQLDDAGRRRSDKAIATMLVTDDYKKLSARKGTATPEELAELKDWEVLGRLSPRFEKRTESYRQLIIRRKNSRAKRSPQ